MIQGLNILFYSTLILLFVATFIQFIGVTIKNSNLKKCAWFIYLIAVLLLSVFLGIRGFVSGRVPLANQFEFATGFTWGVMILVWILSTKFKLTWMKTIGFPTAFLLLSYAAFQPMGISELMPALRSSWFTLHIGSAVFSYASFTLSGVCGVNYLWNIKKGVIEDNPRMIQIDYLSYQLIAFGFLLLTVVILSGSIWAEQAWSSFWTWDPKEVWSLITWILYSVYLHQRIRKKWQGKKMAIFAIVAVFCVLFTFIGVNQFLPGLHSYA